MCLPEIRLQRAIVQIENEIGESVYDYLTGSQWSSYGLEQQPHIVEDWVGGVHGVGSIRMTLASPLFRYMNGNVRLGDGDARTAPGGSVRTWLAEANVKTGSLRQINLPHTKHGGDQIPIPGSEIAIRCGGNRHEP